ncbi:MAG: hypothetical protein K2F83_05925, partial [Oscillospiraceae bacterium]|nr:hypothetical protein [Oscillospiraceae bacterium]
MPSKISQKVQKFLVYQKSTKNRGLRLGAQGVEIWKNMGCQPRVYQMTDSCAKYLGFGVVFVVFRNSEKALVVSYSALRRQKERIPKHLSGVSKEF